MRPQQQDPNIGRDLLGGQFQILQKIGSGGMGAVYKAAQPAMNRMVAVKILHPKLANRKDLVSRFRREARAMSHLSHPNTARVLLYGELDDGALYIVMEYLEGKNLNQVVRKEGPFSVERAIPILVQVCGALQEAHLQGIVHRDLKPENLFLARSDDERMRVKIVDFGLSKLSSVAVDATASDVRARLTEEGTMLGTPLYMSPEQVEALPDVDHRTDLWSMGAILYEALAGAPPFPETSYAKLVLAICHRDPPDLGALAPDVPRAVADACARALRRDRDARFGSAEDFLRALLDAVPDLDVSIARSGPALASSPAAFVPAASPSAPGSLPGASGPGSASSGSGPVPSSGSGSVPGAELRTHTAAGATMWLSQSPAFSLWRGEVDAPDRLRIEARDGSLHELRLEPRGPLKLGRTERVGEERNDLVYPDVASRLAATLRHDGVRWWLKRRDECSVPVQVGARALSRGEEAPLVHGTLVVVGGMRAILVDRRYVTPVVPAGAVDPTTGLLGRAGLEQEVAAFLQRKRPGALVLVPAPVDRAGEAPNGALAAVAVHRARPEDVVGVSDGIVVALVPGERDEVLAAARALADVVRDATRTARACGVWALSGDGTDAGREIELALHAARALEGAPSGDVVALRNAPQNVRFTSADEVVSASRDGKRATLLFAIEEQSALSGVGPHVVAALEQELAAVVATHVGQGALVAQLAPGVVGACVAKKGEPAQIANAVQCEWHARPPVMDGKVELPRSLSWEVLHAVDPASRAGELSRECADPHGVLSALSGGLPYPIAGRVHAAIASSSAIERVKILFEVLEGVWRFMATVLVSAYFARRTAPGETPLGFDAMLEFQRRQGTREGLALGTWRELARLAARGFEPGDPIGALAKDVLEVKLAHNQTFETLSNLMQVERNGFAHGHYNEARAAADLPEFEQMTRALLRALRPLGAWTLVTVEKTEPDLYGEQQTVEFVDHTGPYSSGARRRIGLNSPVRLANVVYLARFREGLVLPLEPLVKRVVHEDRFELFWMDHLPRAGTCTMSAVVAGATMKLPCDLRRLPPLLRTLATTT